MSEEQPKRNRRFSDLLQDLIRLVEDSWADGSLSWSCAEYALVMDRIAPELFDVSPAEARSQAEIIEQIRREHIRDLAEMG